ncbi:MAG: sigma-54 dependent transcriptional regulator [Melioribacteraceae bacterium]|nr:sigma-54 dependent transcriptional regulator [Melioribacteraceae bacterium]MCF8264427.1 sigma-54 dependent transcriptional regulator [Melioribacteraceae bacterium]MCF8413064.1 sigma-54 dependent transcriptional regulator [Melioribacteraceae bacterium]
MSKILIVDDEREICESIKMILEYEDYEVDYHVQSIDGLGALESKSYDALLLDIQMPGMTGFEVLNSLSKRGITLPVIMISAHSSLENAIKSTKLGAFDFIEKPIDREKLLISVRNAVNQTSLLKENKKLKSDKIKETVIIAQSKIMTDILKTVERVAKTDARVMITGENGTGKELIARAIHTSSNRCDEQIIEVNCAAIPNELIESELFGHEKGSFTGAVKQRIGKFELAHKGTLFLDEIGDMAPQAQAKVLRAIEDGKIERVGSGEKIDVDVRLVAATNKNLEEEIENGNFREDLFHRLNVIPIHIPPLRERKEDIVLLADFFLKGSCEKNDFPLKVFTEGAYEYLKAQTWTGNVRELRNFIERIAIMTSEDLITAESISRLSTSSKKEFNDLLDITNSFQEFKDKAEKAFIAKQLDANDWNISKTADILGIQRSHLYNKLKKYNLEKG